MAKYKIIDSGLVVEDDIEDLAKAKNKAAAYMREADIDTIEIVDQATGDVVADGQAIFEVAWIDYEPRPLL